MFWLSACRGQDDDPHTDTDLMSPHSPTTTTPRLRYVNNLNQALAARAYSTQGVAGTNESVYATLMKQELCTADKKISMAMWDLAASGTGSLTYAHITNAMRARWGGLYTAKTAARMNRPYMGVNGPPSTGQCPLCGSADSATHILGECPAHTALHIQRHDAVGRCILKHLRKGAHGGYYIIADVGSMEKLSPYGITEKRIPLWMMPTKEAASRFDIAMVHKRASDIVHGTPPARDTTITAIEIGFRSDYDPELKKLSEKQLQHATSCNALRQRYNLDYQVWDIGHTGMIPSRMRAQAARLGIENVDKLLKDIHCIAVEHALLLVHERRAKEKEVFANTQGTNTNRYMPIGMRRTNAPPR